MESYPDIPDFDLIGAARYLMEKNELKAVKYLEEAFDSGELTAGEILGNYYKKKLEIEKSLKIWKVMAGKNNIYACLELAKYYEHREQEYKKALNWVKKIEKIQKLITVSHIKIDEDQLSHRKKRLLKKISKIGV